MSVFPYKPVPTVTTTRPCVYGDHLDAPYIPPWLETQPFERQAWRDEFRALIDAMNRLTDTQLALLAAGKRPRIRVKAGSRKLEAAE